MSAQLRSLALLVAACVGCCSAIAGGQESANGGAREAVDADILLSGAKIYDGTGGEPFTGDVAIRDGRIVALGQFLLGKVGQQLDCRGLIVAPGFIDLHNHSDRQIVDARTRANINYVLQGCTTVVTGNCGAGPIDVGAYYDAIDAAGAGTNVAHLLPHGTLRDAVLGTAHRAATTDELQQMKQLCAAAMRDGAWGMSTGLIYVPSSYADTNELVAIAETVAEAEGVYVSHIRNESAELLAAVDEALEIGRRAGLPVHISHFKSSGRPSWGLVRRAAEVVEEARRQGQRVTADQYPYVASSTSLDATLIPTWARAGGRDALKKRFDDSQQSARIQEAMRANLQKYLGGETLRIARYRPRREWVGRSLAEISRGEKKDPIDVAIAISRNGGASIINFSMSEDDVRQVMQIPWVATASDGRAYLPGPDRPHPRSYGTFPRKIGRYAIREHVLSMQQAIRSATGLPADILGIPERGYLKEGAFADVVVFDPQEFADAATFEFPHQYSQGVVSLFVNGEPAVFDGTPTGALAGRALRHSVPGD